MNQWNKVHIAFHRIGGAFLLCFGGAYFFAVVGIIVLYYCLPASDAAKTSWFPIILFDPFVLTVAFSIATLLALPVFLLFLLCIFIACIFSKR